MQIGMVGLGRMGANMVRRLMAGGHQCVVYDRTPAAVLALAAEGAKGAASLDQLVRELDAPRAIWVMLPAGKVTDDVITQLGGLLAAGDIVIDGGNTHYVDDVRHAKELGQRGVEFVDCGTSGGVWGVERGYCLMIGAKKEVYEHLEPIFRTLAPGPGNIERTPDRDGLVDAARCRVRGGGDIGLRHAHLAQRFFGALDRILAPGRLEVGRVAILLRIAFKMAAYSCGLAFDQERAVAVADSSDCGEGSGANGYDVISVHGLSSDAKGAGKARRFRGYLARGGREFGPAIVLADEEDGKPPQRGQIEAFMEYSFG